MLLSEPRALQPAVPRVRNRRQGAFSGFCSACPNICYGPTCGGPPRIVSGRGAAGPLKATVGRRPSLVAGGRLGAR